MSTVAQSEYSRTAGSAMVSTVAIFGPGRVGMALARALVDAGIETHIVGPRGTTDIHMIVDVMAPGAIASEPEPAVEAADVVILAVPLHAVDSIDPATLRGAIVIDVMNYWEPIDGYLPDFADAHGTSPVVAAKFPGARIVKAFNHIGYHDLEADRRPAGAPDRRAVAVMSDDDGAAEMAMTLVDAVGFEPVPGGGLHRGPLLEAGGDIFGQRLRADDMRQLLS